MKAVLSKNQITGLTPKEYRVISDRIANEVFAKFRKEESRRRKASK